MKRTVLLVSIVIIIIISFFVYKFANSVSNASRFPSRLGISNAKYIVPFSKLISPSDPQIATNNFENYIFIIDNDGQTQRIYTNGGLYEYSGVTKFDDKWYFDTFGTKRLLEIDSQGNTKIIEPYKREDSIAMLGGYVITSNDKWLVTVTNRGITPNTSYIQETFTISYLNRDNNTWHYTNFQSADSSNVLGLYENYVYYLETISSDTLTSESFELVKFDMSTDTIVSRKKVGSMYSILAHSQLLYTARDILYTVDYLNKENPLENTRSANIFNFKDMSLTPAPYLDGRSVNGIAYIDGKYIVVSVPEGNTRNEYTLTVTTSFDTIDPSRTEYKIPSELISNSVGSVQILADKLVIVVYNSNNYYLRDIGFDGKIIREYLLGNIQSDSNGRWDVGPILPLK